jgi:Acyl-CoA dehydrogenase, N-terminal domain
LDRKIPCVRDPGFCPERRREQDIAEAGKTTCTFAWDDPFDLDGQLSEDEKLVRDKARAFAQGHLLPRAGEDYLEERFDREIMTRVGRVGLLGSAIPQQYAGAMEAAARWPLACPIGFGKFRISLRFGKPSSLRLASVAHIGNHIKSSS